MREEKQYFSKPLYHDMEIKNPGLGPGLFRNQSEIMGKIAEPQVCEERTGK